MSWFKRKPKGMDILSKGTLSLFIHELQGEMKKGDNAINALIKSWVDANNLHPEQVITLSNEEGSTIVKDGFKYTIKNGIPVIEKSK